MAVIAGQRLQTMSYTRVSVHTGGRVALRRDHLQLRATKARAAGAAGPERVFKDNQRRGVPHVFVLRRAAPICSMAPITIWTSCRQDATRQT